MTTYTYLRVLNIIHNDFNRDFCTMFTLIVSTIAVTMTYASLKAFNLVHILMYLLCPSFAFFSFLTLTVFYSYIYMWELKSTKFLRLQVRAHGSSRCLIARIEHLELNRQIRAARPLRNELSHFGHTTLDVSRACVYEILNQVLLLLSF